MRRRAPRVSSIASSAGEAVFNQYSGVWGFVDDRIKSAFIDQAVLTLVRQQDDSFLASKTGFEIIQLIEQWSKETANYIAVKYLMYVTDASECCI